MSSHLLDHLLKFINLLMSLYLGYYPITHMEIDLLLKSSKIYNKVWIQSRRSEWSWNHLQNLHRQQMNDDIGDMYSSRWIHHHMTLAVDSSPTLLPKHYKDVLKLSREDQELWTASMKEGIKSLHERKVWELVDLPKGHKPIKGRWVFALKLDR